MAIIDGVDCGEQYALIENNVVVNVIRCKDDWTAPTGQTKVLINDKPEVAIGDSYDGTNFTIAPDRQGTYTSADYLGFLREERNHLLTDSDWTQSRDVTLSNDSDWQTYRQSLRDLPANTADPSSPTWPTKPS